MFGCLIISSGNSSLKQVKNCCAHISTTGLFANFAALAREPLVRSDSYHLSGVGYAPHSEKAYKKKQQKYHKV